MNFQEPWEAVGENAAALHSELCKEVGLGHALFRLTAIPLACRTDCDDVLFSVSDEAAPFAVVHLTWSGKNEASPWPETTFYKSWQDWLECGENVMP